MSRGRAPVRLHGAGRAAVSAMLLGAIAATPLPAAPGGAAKAAGRGVTIVVGRGQAAVAGRGPAVIVEPGLSEWPSFRGPGGAGVSEGSSPPATFDGVAGTNLAWRTPIPGLAHASPIVWGDRIYLTTAVGSGPPSRFGAELADSPESVRDPSPHEWKMLALDKRSGAVVWERTAATGVPQTGRLRKGSFNNSTPATDGVRVVAFFGSEGLFCYDLDGNLVWHVDLGVIDAGWFFDPTFQWGTAGSPIIFDGKVILQVDAHSGSYIAAFDASDGRELWRTGRPAVSSWSTPTVVVDAGSTEIVTNGGGAVRAYDPNTGAELWHLAADSEVAVATPVFARGLIFVGSGYLPRRPFFAIRPGGRGDLAAAIGSGNDSRVAWRAPDKGPLISTPIVIGDFVYVLSRAGVLACFDAVSGIPIYEQAIDSTEAAATYTASPVASGGSMYIASDAGTVYTVRAGAFLTVEATNPVGEPIVATPALSEGYLIVRGRNSLFAFGR